MTAKDITVIRYGHREIRDYRVTSHCALVSRALGAKKIIICGEKEENTEKTIKGVNKRWGGDFKVEYTDNWLTTLKQLKKKKYKIIHLTMYGTPIQQILTKLEKEPKLGVLIGSQKVERGVYENADYNVAIASQPHSEIAALAVFLDRVQKGEELGKTFKKAKQKIIPQEKGKKVIDLK